LAATATDLLPMKGQAVAAIIMSTSGGTR